jgi:replication factor C subunit 1
MSCFGFFYFVYYIWIGQLFHRSKHPKSVLIMDEVDGMSAGDRGGVADLIASIKVSKIPIICICNDRYSQKLKTLVNYCLMLNFRKPTKQQVIVSHMYQIVDFVSE